MNLGIKNRIAVVGGSTAGIGRACAEALLEEGVKVVICGRDQGRLDEAIKTLSGNGEVVGVACDLATRQGVSTVLDAARRLGPISICVVNTGGPPPGELLDFDDDDWYSAAQLTLMSVVRLCRGVYEEMKDQKWGRIVLLSSISVKQVLENMVLSNTLRAGVKSLGKTLSRTWSSSGITVNTVCSGYTLTDRVQSLAKTNAEKKKMRVEQVFEEIQRTIPMGRLADPSEIANVVAFICSDRASYLNGVSLAVDGGWTTCLD